MYLAERIVEGITLSIVCLLAFFGNLSLWFIIFSTRNLRETSYYMVLLLSVADIFVSIVSMPITIYTIIEGDWRFSEVTCVVIGFINMSTFIASVMSLGTISLNRYIKICHPHRYQKIYTVRNVVLMTTGVWCVSFLLALPPLLGWGRYTFLPKQSFCFCDWKMSVSYTIFMITVCFGGPCFTMTFCYYKILKTFRKSSSRLFGGSRPLFGKPRCLGKKISMDSSSQSFMCADTSDTKGSELVSTVYKEPPKLLSPFYQSTINVAVQPKTVPVSTTQGTQLSQITLSAANEGKQLSKNTDSYADQGKQLTQNTAKELDRNTVSLSDQGKELGRNTVSPSHQGKQLCQVTVSSASHQEKQTRRVTSTAPPLHVTQRRRVTVNPQLDDSSNIQISRQQARRRNEEFVLSAALLLVIFVFIICWLPFCITMFITVFSPNDVPKQADMFTLMLGYINSCCNPVIYGFLNKRFKAGYKTFFRKMCSCCKSCSASVAVDPICTVT